MSMLEVTNRDTAEKVWIDARYSNGGVPFCELGRISGFPRWIGRNETVEVDMFDWNELLYRRSMDPNSVDECHLSDLYRIGLTGRGSFESGFIWPLPFFPSNHSLTSPVASSAESNSQNCFTEKNSYQDAYLGGKCGATAKQTEVVSEETVKGLKATRIRLESKVRTVRNYLIEPFVAVGGYFRSNQQAYLVSVTVTNLSNGKTGTRLIIEALADEALSLIDSFLIKKGNLEAKPRSSKWGYTLVESYRSRGFRVPISVPLTQFFGQALP